MSAEIEPPAILVGTVREWLKSKHLGHAAVRYRLDDRDAIRNAGSKVKPGDKVWTVETSCDFGSFEVYAIQPAEGTQLVWPNEAAKMLERQYKRIQEKLGL